MQNHPVLNLSESLLRGLVPRSDLPPGYPGFTVLRNMRKTNGRLRPFVSVTQPVEDGDFTAGHKVWPSVLLHVGKSKVRLLTRFGVFGVDPDDWSITTMLHRDAARFDLGDAMTKATTAWSGGQWHVIDLYDYFLAFNGTQTVWQTGHATEQADIVYHTDSVTIRTGGLYNDSQPFMGGFNPANIYALADWLTYLKTLYANADANTKAAIDALTGGAGANWVWTGTIGGGDLMWFASMYLMKRGHLPPNRLNNAWWATPASTWTAGTGWAFSGAGVERTAVHTPGSTAALSQAAASQDYAIASGSSYRVRFTVSGRTAGSVRASLGTANGAVRSTNASFEETITAATNGDFALTPSTDFDGTISRLAVQPTAADVFGDNFWSGEILPRNEAAFMPMPWMGDVVHMKQLGDKIVVYGMENSAGGHGGISVLVPAGKHWGVWPVPGFPSGVGIVGRGAVSGDETQHVFLDDTGDLWRITSDLQAQRLEHKHQLSNLDEHSSFSYDPLEGEHYLSVGAFDGETAEECWVLDKDGLSRSHTAPVCLGRTQGGLVGVTFSVSGDAATVLAETHPIDATSFGGRAHEMLTVRKVMVQTLDSNPAGWKCRVSYRMDTGDAFIDTTAAALDLRGHIYFAVPCLQFKIRLEHPDRTKTNGIGAIHIQASLGARGSYKHLVQNGPPSAVTI